MSPPRSKGNWRSMLSRLFRCSTLMTSPPPLGSDLLDRRHPVHELAHPLADGEDDGHHGLLRRRPFDRADADGVVPGVAVELLHDRTGLGVSAPQVAGPRPRLPEPWE